MMLLSLSVTDPGTVTGVHLISELLGSGVVVGRSAAEELFWTETSSTEAHGAMLELGDDAGSPPSGSRSRSSAISFFGVLVDAKFIILLSLSLTEPGTVTGVDPISGALDSGVRVGELSVEIWEVRDFCPS